MHYAGNHVHDGEKEVYHVHDGDMTNHSMHEELIVCMVDCSLDTFLVT